MAPKARVSARLTSVRRRINRFDARLLRLLNQRAKLALTIGRIKKRRKWPVFDAAREASVLRHVIAANEGPLSEAAVRHIFQAILCECRRRERVLPKKRLRQSVVRRP